LARGGAHQGFIAKVLEPSFVTLKSFSESNFIILAVGVTDMGNIGQIIRTAYTLGVDGIVLSGAKNFSLDKAAKPSSGALFDIKVAFMPNPLDALNELKLAGFKFYGADINGTDVKSIQFTGKKVLILGSEHDGIPVRVLDRCDEKISIKMENNFDSLNVASAAAILIDRMR
jgi:23S rRNA (guanosine2251-2'-O)-methyltransferase